MSSLAAELRARLAASAERLVSAWQQTGDSLALLAGRSSSVDEALCGLWAAQEFPPDYALVAVGGYGRGELYPASDVDLLILLPNLADPADAPVIERFVGLLWDIGLDIGHSVRCVDECLTESENDITIKTALLEARLIAGSVGHFNELERRLGERLDALAFLKAKRMEQAERYTRFNDTPFALEPNCKESPGGLRDLQIIHWVARAAGRGDTWAALANAGLLRRSELRQLGTSESWLRELRIRLHLLTRRREDRLLFDHQENLARAMKLEPTSTRRAAEVLMQQYYLNARQVTLLNTLLLEILAETLQPERRAICIVIDEDFQTVQDLLDIRDEQIFEREPAAMLRCFQWQMQRHELKGMTPRTLRALWHARTRIDAAFRREPAHRALFLSLFRQKHLIHVLRRMNQYDILGRYLPAFGRIVGQMQHDLFHVYTVDQHILQVMRNLRRFSMPEFAHEYPFCSRLMSGFDKPWLLYLGALFHDIAKGRGGDHSRLGVADARRFCRDHGLAADETELVCFLVGEHLTLSTVAQKQDLTDPDVIARFAALVGDERHLVALYLLTVADIRGTSPKVWNAWKGKLFEDLYRMASGLLAGDMAPQMFGISERQEEARRVLRFHGLRQNVEKPLWEQLDIGYFMRHEAEEIAWHTRTLYHRPDSATPVVQARLNSKTEGIQLMVYIQDQAKLFARLCGFFARKGFSIVDAKIDTTRHGYALDSFVVLDTNGRHAYRDVIALMEHELTAWLQQDDAPMSAPGGRLSRQVKHFPIIPEIDIRADERGSHYLMSITAADRPGMLFDLANLLARHDIRLHSAKIATLGERVEDTFLISGRELTHTASLVRLEQDLLNVLSV